MHLYLLIPLNSVGSRMALDLDDFPMFYTSLLGPHSVIVIHTTYFITFNKICMPVIIRFKE